METLQLAVQQKDQSIISLMERCEEMAKTEASRENSPRTSDNKELELKLQELEKSVTDKDSQIESLQQMINAKMETLQTKENDLHSLGVSLENMQRQYKELEERQSEAPPQTSPESSEHLKSVIEQKEKLIQQLCDDNAHLQNQIDSMSAVANDTVPETRILHESKSDSALLSASLSSSSLDDLNVTMQDKDGVISQLQETVTEREAQIDQLCAENAALMERLGSSKEPSITIPTESSSLENRVQELENILAEKETLLENIYQENVQLANIDRPPKADTEITYQIQVLQTQLDEKEKVVLELETALDEKERLFQQACRENSALLQNNAQSGTDSAPESGTVPDGHSGKLAEELEEAQNVLELEEKLIQQLYDETDHLNEKLDNVAKPASEREAEIKRLTDKVCHLWLFNFVYSSFGHIHCHCFFYEAQGVGI